MITNNHSAIALAGLAKTAQGLDQLRLQAKNSPDQALKATAQQFETVFMNMMLKSMRSATPQDGMFDNEQTKMFTEMLDQQLAQSMSSRGIGLADMMVKQLSRTINPANAAGSPVKPEPGIALTPQAKSASALPAAGPGLPQDFVRRMNPYATATSQATGIPAQLMIGQAALESGWGRREINLPDGSNSYNLFAIKAGDNWKGKVTEITTTEYHNGIASKQVEKFRVYDSYAEAFDDYAHLLRDNPRYASVMQAGQAAPDAARALQRAGYATDPEYATKLVKVINRINILG
ncbi:MAG: flagellar assembly peptidoglycan hydrolase FlgJ [Pseudomonadota bacterium]